MSPDHSRWTRAGTHSCRTLNEKILYVSGQECIPVLLCCPDREREQEGRKKTCLLSRREPGVALTQVYQREILHYITDYCVGMMMTSSSYHKSRRGGVVSELGQQLFDRQLDSWSTL